MVAEIVTQLPVPSRLGLMRFERLNEASWAMLFLDPTCERTLGLPASELCALIDAPYASLMEPESRYRLHDEVQLQLARQPHYSIQYTLHAPGGPLCLQEIGEFRELYRRECFQSGIDYVALDTSMPFDRALTEYLIMRTSRA